MAEFRILARAPLGDEVTDYDREHFLTYARLIDAERAGITWTEAAAGILLCEVDADLEECRLCWESHLVRAHWVIGRQ